MSTDLHDYGIHDKKFMHDELLPDEDPHAAEHWESTSEAQEIAYHVPVVQINTPPAARNGIHFTYVLSTTVNPVQELLGRDYDRVKAYVTAVDQPVVIVQQKEQAQAAVNTQQASTVSSTGAIGQQTAPTAGTAIATLPLAAGTWQVNVSVWLGGTIAADGSNMAVYLGATQITPLANLPQSGLQVPANVTVAVPAGGASLIVQAVANASAAVVYHAQIIATPVPATTFTGPVPSGEYLPAGMTRVIEHCDTVYVAATSASLGRVSVQVCRTERASA